MCPQGWVSCCFRWSHPQPPSAPRGPHPTWPPGGSARLGSAAAVRLLGLGELRRLRRRGEPGAPPRLQKQRPPPVRSRHPSACGTGGAHGDSGARARVRSGLGSALQSTHPYSQAQPPPGAHRAGRSAKRRCWGSVRDTKATWGRLGARWVGPPPTAQDRPKGAASSAPSHAVVPPAFQQRSDSELQ